MENVFSVIIWSSSCLVSLWC